jgi:hypothetical protein
MKKKRKSKKTLRICKIHSFTYYFFLFPGGGLLLPVTIKFIPTLLPSAFNEKLLEE